MPQGKHTTAKKKERPKEKRAPRGDQQKLRVGAQMQFKAKIPKKQAEERANSALTKKITQRIEQTMAARAGTDGGGLAMVKVEEGGGSMTMKTLKKSASEIAKNTFSR